MNFKKTFLLICLFPLLAHAAHNQHCLKTPPIIFSPTIHIPPIELPAIPAPQLPPAFFSKSLGSLAAAGTIVTSMLLLIEKNKCNKNEKSDDSAYINAYSACAATAGTSIGLSIAYNEGVWSVSAGTFVLSAILVGALKWQK